MKVAVAGLGTATGRGHLPALLALERRGDLELVAAADPDPDRHTHAAAQLRRARFFDSAEAMLGGVRSDVLIVASSPSSHVELVELGLRRGQHVVCEKPLVLTRDEHARVRAACAAHPDLGLVPVHQFRYARSWRPMRCLARLADRLRTPFSLEVEVERDGTDKLAATRWRDTAEAGGMIADQGSHFLALGQTITQKVEALRASRVWDHDGRERASARLQLGSGVLDFTSSAAEPEARTRLRLRLPMAELDWADDSLALRSTSGRSYHQRAAGALSDRRYTDLLYRPFYRELAGSLLVTSWRRRRTAEALRVSSAMVALLEAAGAPAARAEQ